MLLFELVGAVVADIGEDKRTPEKVDKEDEDGADGFNLPMTPMDEVDDGVEGFSDGTACGIVQEEYSETVYSTFTWGILCRYGGKGIDNKIVQIQIN